MILRSPRFQHWMARLALAAVLLVAVMPTVSRWLDGGAQRSPDAVLAMCTMGGLVMKPAILPGDPGKAPAPSGATPEAYCAYCPLLSGLAPLLLALAILSPPLRRALLPAWKRSATPVRPLLRGLGARGPPLPL